jgi:hypothetical protein
MNYGGSRTIFRFERKLPLTNQTGPAPSKKWEKGQLMATHFVPRKIEGVQTEK